MAPIFCAESALTINECAEIARRNAELEKENRRLHGAVLSQQLRGDNQMEMIRSQQNTIFRLETELSVFRGGESMH